MSQHTLPISASFPPKGKTTLCEGIQILSEAGYDAIDIALQNCKGLLDPKDREKKVENAKAALDSAGIVAISGHLPFHKQDMRLIREDILSAIEVAGLLGLKRAVLHPVGPFETENTPEAQKYWHDQNIAHYEFYLPYAEKAGIQLVTENMRNPLWREGYHRYATNADELIAIADPLGLEVCWDFGHAHGAGLDHETELKKLGSRLTMLHVNDNYGINDEHLPPFYGSADWDSAIRGLRAIGYRGHFNMELKFRSFPPDILPAAASAARGIAAAFTKRLTEEAL